MTTFVQKVTLLAAAMDDAGLPYAIGGALALGYCVPNPRATADIDVNVFIPPSEVSVLRASLPPEVVVTDRDAALLARDAQARVFWDRTPVDVFMSNVAFHDEAATRVHRRLWVDQEVCFLACRDLAVFKALFDRQKDWVDLREMLARASFDVPWVLGTLVQHLGGADHRVERLRSLAAEVAASEPEGWKG